jgi:hypothetical protein
MESWRWVPGYEGSYEVSDMGHVRSFRLPGGNAELRRSKPRALAGSINPQSGYHFTALANDDDPAHPWSVKIGTLVLLAFVGPRPQGAIIRHLNGNKLDNRLENLRYGTPKENAQDALAHGHYKGATKTHCNRGHPLSGDNVYAHRGTRTCRACHRLHTRASYAQVKEEAAARGVPVRLLWGKGRDRWDEIIQQSS